MEFGMILVTISHECQTSACAVYIRDVRIAMTLRKLTYTEKAGVHSTVATWLAASA